MNKSEIIISVVLFILFGISAAVTRQATKEKR